MLHLKDWLSVSCFFFFVLQRRLSAAEAASLISGSGLPPELHEDETWFAADSYPPPHPPTPTPRPLSISLEILKQLLSDNP